jgi:hypothetical protein
LFKTVIITVSPVVQVEVDQMHLSSLAEFDDGRDLAGYDFFTFSYSSAVLSLAENNRLMAYRYRAMQPRYSAGNGQHSVQKHRQGTGFTMISKEAMFMLFVYVST